MTDALTVTVALAGLFFSLSCAFLLQELVFGTIFRAMAYSRRLVKKQELTTDWHG